MDFDDLLKEAINLLIEKVNPFMVYLFGSASRDKLRENSDIDIAYISDIKLTSYQNFMLAQDLADIFKRDVDLINLMRATVVFKAQVVGKGKKIYCNDETRRMNFEMEAFNDYATLNEERDIIMRNIKKSDSVYGQ